MEERSSLPPKMEPSGSADSSQHDGCCPVCFQDEDLAVAPCQHAFCVSCLERILLSGSHADQYPGRSEMGEFVSPDYPAGREQNVDELKIPAWNACPICRRPLFLWDLRRRSHTEGTASTTTKSTVDDLSFSAGCEGPFKGLEGTESTSPSVAKSVAAASSQIGEYVYSRECPKWEDIPFLRGSTWLECTNGVMGRVGYGSFHFPPHVDDPDVTVPYYNLERVSHKRLLFKDCFYHAKGRILGASLHPEDEMDIDGSTYRLVLAFSADGGLVRNGALVVQQPVLTPSGHVAQFPFDGFYKFQDERLTVVGHKCILNGQPLLLQKAVEVDEDYSDSVGNEDKDAIPVQLMKLVTPERRVVGTMELTSGVGVGAQLVWNLRGSLSPLGTRRTWNWVRESGPSAVSDRLPRHKIHRWGGPYARRWLKRQGPLPLEDGSRSRIPTYHGDSVWGNVFCQAFKVGLASYHFVSPSEGEGIGTVYISYENPSTSEWPPLDNGQPIPAKVHFHNISFPTATSFRGQILWQEDFGTPWQGMIRWEYEMIFDEKFTCIVGGSVTSFEVDSPDVPRELSRYGESLVYVNAALYQEFRRLVVEEEEEVARDRNTAVTDQESTATMSTLTADGDRNRTVHEDWTDRFRARSLELRLRLQRENAPVRTSAMVHRLMTIAYQGEGEPCPIDYNLHADVEVDE